MWHLFKTPTAREVAVQQLAEAERLALEHRAAAESHASTANMLDARAARLREWLGFSTLRPEGKSWVVTVGGGSGGGGDNNKGPTS